MQTLCTRTQCVHSMLVFDYNYRCNKGMNFFFPSFLSCFVVSDWKWKMLWVWPSKEGSKTHTPLIHSTFKLTELVKPFNIVLLFYCIVRLMHLLVACNVTTHNVCLEHSTVSELKKYTTSSSEGLYISTKPVLMHRNMYCIHSYSHRQKHPVWIS